MQKALIVKGNRGYLHLAHRYGAAVQISVENFVSWAEAARWCNAHDIRAFLQFGETEIPVRHWTLLCLMSPGKAHTTSELCDLLADYQQTLQYRDKPPLDPTPERIRPTLTLMERHGLVSITRPGIKGMEWKVQRGLDPHKIESSLFHPSLASAA